MKHMYKKVNAILILCNKYMKHLYKQKTYSTMHTNELIVYSVVLKFLLQT